MSDPSDNPCVRHGCHQCCVGTRMSLTEADVERLEGAGFSGFVHLERNGDFELNNRDGRCVFLSGDECRAYGHRPEGCRLYPLVLDLTVDRVVRDDLCPHRGEFPISPGDEDRLRWSVVREQAEARKRRGMGG